MQKLVPIWVFLLCLLLGILSAAGFGWVVVTTIGGNDRFGKLGNAAVAVASFPDTVRTTLREMHYDPDQYLRVPRTGADLSGFVAVAAKPGIHIQGLLVRADETALAKAPGWRVVVGGFTIDGQFTHAALALSPELKVMKVWKLHEQDTASEKARAVYNKYVHGFAILKDGSVMFAFIPGVGLQRFDACGRPLWTTAGNFHHAIVLDDDQQYAWTLRDEMAGDELLNATLVKVATATGKVVRRISMDEVIAANPLIDILQIRQDDANWGNGNPRTNTEKWLVDPYHLNDVEPLPAAMAGRFKEFKAGDLLVSVRNLNLLMVLDPESLQIKWWRSGLWRRQHDPDWQPTGEISLLDNRMDREYSRIVSIAPDSITPKVLFDGRRNDFYTRIRGSHQFTPTGDLLVASTQQGRVFEVDANGNTVFDMYNTKPGSNQFSYPIADALWISSDAFDFAKDPSCAE